jgi:hypothetical protein
LAPARAKLHARGERGRPLRLPGRGFFNFLILADQAIPALVILVLLIVVLLPHWPGHSLTGLAISASPSRPSAPGTVGLGRLPSEAARTVQAGGLY